MAVQRWPAGRQFIVFGEITQSRLQRYDGLIWDKLNWLEYVSSSRKTQIPLYPTPQLKAWMRSLILAFALPYYFSCDETVNRGAHVRLLGSLLMLWQCLLESIYGPLESPLSWTSTTMTIGKNNSWRKMIARSLKWLGPIHLYWEPGGSGRFSYFPGYTAWSEFESRPVYFQSLTFIIKTYTIIGWVSGTMRGVYRKCAGECSRDLLL